MTREQGGGEKKLKDGLLFQSVISPYLQTESGYSCWSETAPTVKQHDMPQNDFCIQTTLLSVPVDFKHQCAELEKDRLDVENHEFVARNCELKLSIVKYLDVHPPTFQPRRPNRE